jgi:hypothetical protein
LRKVVDALLAEVDPANVDVLRRRSAHSLDDNGGVRFQDDAVVDNLIDGEGDEVVVFDNGALVDRLPAGNFPITLARLDDGGSQREKGKRE